MGLRKSERELLVDRIVMVASKDEELSVSRIAERFRLSPSCVKRILADNGLNRTWSKGSGCYYETGTI